VNETRGRGRREASYTRRMLQHAEDDTRTVITDVEIEPAGTSSVLPALRSDLAPLVPTVRRAATVIATVAVADWALRTSSRALLREVLSAVGRRTGTRPPTPAARPGSETLIIERVILQRTP
jgi:hypothetical protein